MVPWRLAMRGLLRDSALFLVATLVLGTAANLLPGRGLAWWGQGHQPPHEGVDFMAIDPGSAETMLTSLPHVVFLDTRSAAAFAAAHVPGAQRISYTDIDTQLTHQRLAELRAADAVVVYGASEETDVEQLVAQELRLRGLAPPYVLDGGFGAWQGAGLPVEGTGE
jgi:rhodanese-related sulfurtransferase